MKTNNCCCSAEKTDNEKNSCCSSAEYEVKKNSCCCSKESDVAGRFELSEDAFDDDEDICCDLFNNAENDSANKDKKTRRTCC